MQNAQYVEDRLGTPSGAQKMAVSAPFWRPNGFENGFLTASETATAPQDLKDTQKASKKARKKIRRPRAPSTGAASPPEPPPL